MKIIDKIKSNKTQTHLIALLLYIVGAGCDLFGHVSGGIEPLGYIYLITFTIYGIALFIIWDEKNKRYLKAARVNIGFLSAGIAILFVSWHYKMYPTFAFTLIFLLVVAICFIKTLYNICFAYYYDKWD